MALTTYAAGPFAPGVPFTFKVPGQYSWRLLSVLGVASRAAGGSGTRAFTLTLASGAQPLVIAPGVDTAPDPGVMNVTWANLQPGITALVSDGAMVIPFPVLVAPAGYVLTGAMVNPQPADQWTAATVWVDQWGNA